MNSLTVARLAELTLELLADGRETSAHIRGDIIAELDLDPALLANRRFINLHAWALVRLQAAGAIVKLGPGQYALKVAEASPASEIAIQPFPTDDSKPLPKWARDVIRSANARNRKRWNGEPFTRDDLARLWNDCGGQCSLTALSFRETEIGSGQARRPYAPSLDRIDTSKPYSSANCRLVLASVNFALNSFGDDVFVQMTDAAVAARQRKAHQQELAP